MGGGQWLGDGAHMVDWVTHLIGTKAVSVKAVLGTYMHSMSGDDTATALIQYANGVAGVVLMVAHARGPEETGMVDVHGAQGRLQLDWVSDAGPHGQVRVGTGRRLARPGHRAHQPTLPSSTATSPPRSPPATARRPAAPTAATSWKSCSRPSAPASPAARSCWSRSNASPGRELAARRQSANRGLSVGGLRCGHTDARPPKAFPA